MKIQFAAASYHSVTWADPKYSCEPNRAWKQFSFLLIASQFLKWAHIIYAHTFSSKNATALATPNVECARIWVVKQESTRHAWRVIRNSHETSCLCCQEYLVRKSKHVTLETSRGSFTLHSERRRSFFAGLKFPGLKVGIFWKETHSRHPERIGINVCMFVFLCVFLSLKD